MTSRIEICVVLGLAAALGGCNESGGGIVPTATSPIAVATPGLPPGAPCTKEIDSYGNVVKSDLDTGNVEQKVYDQIQHELSRAASACSAGKGGEAHAIVAASKAKHGYRA